MFGANTSMFVETPLFVLNSKYDTWQAGGIIGAGSCGKNISNCSAKIQTFWGGYGQRMVSILQALPPQHGGFLSNCQAHCQTESAGAWTSRTVDGMPMGEAVAGWYNATMLAAGAGAVRAGNHTAASHRYYEACDIRPCGTDRCNP